MEPFFKVKLVRRYIRNRANEHWSLRDTQTSNAKDFGDNACHICELTLLKPVNGHR